MRKALFSILFLALALSVIAWERAAQAKANQESEIRSLEQHWQEAFKAKDSDKIMSFYEHSPTLVAFDVIPPRQYLGWEAYKKDWKEFFDLFSGPVTIDISDLTIETDRNLAYSHSIQHFSGALKDGGKLDVTLRATDAYRKSGSRWLIAHEHVSVPVDLKTGKADLESKP